MAVTQTTTVRRTLVSTERKYVEADLTFAGTYVTGGHAVAASDFGLQSLIGIEYIGGSGGYAYDHTTGLARLYVATTGAEVANAADPVAQKARVRAIGT